LSNQLELKLKLSSWYAKQLPPPPRPVFKLKVSYGSGDHRLKSFLFFVQVEDSMENLEFVVRERNRAFFELEIGESGKSFVDLLFVFVAVSFGSDQ